MATDAATGWKAQQVATVKFNDFKIRHSYENYLLNINNLKNAIGDCVGILSLPARIFRTFQSALGYEVERTLNFGDRWIFSLIFD